jgi:hypothetical protein
MPYGNDRRIEVHDEDIRITIEGKGQIFGS